MSGDQRGFIRADGKEMAVCECSLSLGRDGGAMDDIAGGRPSHALSLSVEPDADGFPFLVINDAELFVDGDPLEALDRLRVNQNLDEEGDLDGPEGFDASKLPWIRPGSLVGATEVIYEPPSKHDGDDWDPDAGKFLRGPLSIGIDRDGDLWRVEVRTDHDAESHAGAPSPHFHALFWAKLELLDGA